MKKLTNIFAGLAAALALNVSAPAEAQEPIDMVSFSMLSGWRTSSGTHMTAIRMTLEPGWKTYWRAPGDAGIPPQFRWTGLQRSQQPNVHWPVPTVFLQNGLKSVGYENEVLIPIEVPTPGGPQDFRLQGEVQIGICEEICVPVMFPVDVMLRGSARTKDPNIQAALQSRPMSPAEAGGDRVVCTVEQIADGLKLTARMDLPAMAASEHAVVEFADKTVWVSEATVTRSGGQLQAIVDMVPPNAQPFLLSRSDLTFTVLGDGRSVEFEGCTAG